jgi:hypothetical protein
MLKTLLITAIVGFALVGCTPSDAPASSTDGTVATQSEEMGKCGLCGGEFKKSELKEHDGQPACEKCIAMHNH